MSLIPADSEPLWYAREILVAMAEMPLPPRRKVTGAEPVRQGTTVRPWGEPVILDYRAMTEIRVLPRDKARRDALEWIALNFIRPAAYSLAGHITERGPGGLVMAPMAGSDDSRGARWTTLSDENSGLAILATVGSQAGETVTTVRFDVLFGFDPRCGEKS